MKFRLVLLAASLSTGCGLVSSDVLDFPLDIKPKTFTIDTANWMVDQQAADAYTGTSCAQNMAICGTAVDQACAADCTGSCDAASHKCDLALQVALYSKVDLQMEQSELGSIDAKKGISVTIDGASYQVMDNELTVETP